MDDKPGGVYWCNSVCVQGIQSCNLCGLAIRTVGSSRVEVNSLEGCE